MKCGNTALEQRLEKPEMFDKTCHHPLPPWGSRYPVQVQPCCVPRLLMTRAQVRSQPRSRPGGGCGSVGSWWSDEGWLPTSSLCSAAEHTVLGLQTQSFSRPESGPEGNSPKGNIAAADDYCWSSYFCSFCLLHVGGQLLLGCKGRERCSL